MIMFLFIDRNYGHTITFNQISDCKNKNYFKLLLSAARRIISWYFKILSNKQHYWLIIHRFKWFYKILLRKCFSIKGMNICFEFMIYYCYI